MRSAPLARSARSCRVVAPVMIQSGDTSPSPVPLMGWFDETFVIWTVGAPSTRSTACTVMVTSTILWFGGQRFAGDTLASTIVGGVVSMTAMWKEPVATLPDKSLAEQFTVVAPRATTEPDGGTQVTGTGPSTASTAVAVKVAVAPLGPVASTLKSAGRGSTGGGLSPPSTVTVKEPVVMPPPAFVAVHSTVLTLKKVEPEGGVDTPVGPASLVNV